MVTQSASFSGCFKRTAQPRSSRDGLDTGHGAQMWGITALFVACIATQATSQHIKAECKENDAFPPENDFSPSAESLAELKVDAIKVEGSNMLNISWRISIDSSTKYLTGAHLSCGDEYVMCTYDPPFSQQNITKLGDESKQLWFSYLAATVAGPTRVEVRNLPLPPWGSDQPVAKSVYLDVPYAVTFTQRSSALTDAIETTSVGRTFSPQKDPSSFTNIAAAIFGGLACLMVLSSCYMIYKNCGSNFATSLGFKMLPSSSVTPVPVLVVYPAADAAFQQAVVALAEFLQWHGGCSVTMDMWQQGKIGELGPLRWLAEQHKAADRVLIVCPQPSSHLRDSPNHCLVDPCAPSAAHDLYPLVLNMVASHAKNARELEKFWVVQLCSRPAQRSANLPSELKACKTFCLTKDLNKLCKSLHTQRQDGKKISKPVLKPMFEKNTAKLKEAVGKLGGDTVQLKSVVSVV